MRGTAPLLFVACVATVSLGLTRTSCCTLAAYRVQIIRFLHSEMVGVMSTASSPLARMLQSIALGLRSAIVIVAAVCGVILSYA